MSPERRRRMQFGALLITAGGILVLGGEYLLREGPVQWPLLVIGLTGVIAGGVLSVVALTARSR